MKTALIALVFASLLGIASLASGRAFDAADFLALAFVTGLLAWTMAQYRTEPRALTKAPRIFLPLNSSTPPMARPAVREVA